MCVCTQLPISWVLPGLLKFGNHVTFTVFHWPKAIPDSRGGEISFTSYDTAECCGVLCIDRVVIRRPTELLHVDSRSRPVLRTHLCSQWGRDTYISPDYQTQSLNAQGIFVEEGTELAQPQQTLPTRLISFAIIPLA